MSQDDVIEKPDRENGVPSGQDSVDAAVEPKQVAGTEAPPAAGEADQAISGHLTIGTLNRYLAAVAEGREAAEERSSQVIARFTKLTIAMMCLTMVIAGANVAMIIRQSNRVQPIVAAPPRPVETPPVLVQPAQPILPAPVPSEPREPPRPAEKIPLLGSSSTRARQAPLPGPPRLARPASPRPQALLSARSVENRSVENDSRESGPVERW